MARYQMLQDYKFSNADDDFDEGWAVQEEIQPRKYKSVQEALDTLYDLNSALYTVQAVNYVSMAESSHGGKSTNTANTKREDYMELLEVFREARIRSGEKFWMTWEMLSINLQTSEEVARELQLTHPAVLYREIQVDKNIWEILRARNMIRCQPEGFNAETLSAVQRRHKVSSRLNPYNPLECVTAAHSDSQQVIEFKVGDEIARYVPHYDNKYVVTEFGSVYRNDDSEWVEMFAKPSTLQFTFYSGYGPTTWRVGELMELVWDDLNVSTYYISDRAVMNILRYEYHVDRDEVNAFMQDNTYKMTVRNEAPRKDTMMTIKR